MTLARETYLEALMAAQFAGRLADGAALEVAEAARAAPPPPSPRAPDLLLDGLATMLVDGHRAAAAAPEAGRAASSAARRPGGFRWLWLAEEAAIEMWDHDSWRELAVRELRLVREAGALTVLPLALSANIVALIFAGELAAAGSLIDEVKIVTEATGTQLAPYGALILAAWRGREAELSAGRLDARGGGAARRGHRREHRPVGGRAAPQRARRVRARLGRGPARARDARGGWTRRSTGCCPSSSRRPRAPVSPRSPHDALGRLTDITRAGGTDWALGIEARSRALLSEGEPAETLYREAIERLGRTRIRGEHARAHLLYGEWLRRDGRRKDAREQLRIAHRRFADMGMEAFAERARRELLATGATTRKRRAATRDELTPQEWQIARLARDGLTNSEIGGRLFLSPRTVEWHLRKVFTKLGISSRMGLHDALPRDSAPA